jgi:hypothetical protein
MVDARNEGEDDERGGNWKGVRPGVAEDVAVVVDFVVVVEAVVLRSKWEVMAERARAASPKSGGGAVLPFIRSLKWYSCASTLA